MIRILRLVGSVLSGFIAFGILASVTFLLKLKLDEKIDASRRRGLIPHPIPGDCPLQSDRGELYDRLFSSTIR